MESIDIVIIVITTVIVLVMCGSCVTKGRVYNRQLALRRFNAVMPLPEYQTREEMENSIKQENPQTIYPIIVISCL